MYMYVYIYTYICIYTRMFFTVKTTVNKRKIKFRNL